MPALFDCQDCNAEKELLVFQTNVPQKQIRSSNLGGKNQVSNYGKSFVGIFEEVRTKSSFSPFRTIKRSEQIDSFFTRKGLLQLIKKVG